MSEEEENEERKQARGRRKKSVHVISEVKGHHITVS